MIDFEVKGAIFDFDDTLLDNRPDPKGLGLHEKSRLQAAREVGADSNIPELEFLSEEDNLQGFLTAPVHSLDSAVWNILFRANLVATENMDASHPILQQIITRKNELYEDILINEGQEVTGAADFVRALAAQNLEDKMALATTAIRRDVDIFVSKIGLDQLFPGPRRFTKERVEQAKPNPEVYNLAFASLELPEEARSQVCAFEDDPRGIMSARAAGLFVCAIATRYAPEALRSLEVPPHLVAESYQDMMGIFGLSAKA